MKRFILITAAALCCLLSTPAQAQTTEELEDLSVADLMRLQAQADAEFRVAEEEYQAALARLREANQTLDQACGEQPDPTNVAMAKATMDQQIARSAGILADQNSLEADNNMFGTGGIGVGADAFVGGVIGSSYRDYGGGQIMMGALDKSVIDRVVKRHLEKIRACYSEQKAADPELASGLIVVKFVITANSTVSSAKIEKSELDNAAVEQCVCNQFLQMEFPAPYLGRVVIQEYPIVFN